MAFGPFSDGFFFFKNSLDQLEKCNEHFPFSFPTNNFFLENEIFFLGFDDTFKLLERLSVYVFDLPVDIAVKQFEELEEAF